MKALLNLKMTNLTVKFMKKFILILFSLIFLVGFTSSNIKIQVNNNTIKTSVPPAVIEGRVLVPVSDIALALNAQVKWAGESKIVFISYEGKMIAIKIGENNFSVTDLAYGTNNNLCFDVAARIIDGKTFVPLRGVGEAFGANVLWEENSRTVKIFTSKD